MSNRTVGTCSLCGGAVTVPDPWMGTMPPTPSCSTCGAIPCEPHGPVVQMRPRRTDSGGIGVAVFTMPDGSKRLERVP